MGKPKYNPEPAQSGYINQVDAISTVASPLLAGFSLASVIIVSDDARNFRWPGAAMLALTIAAIMLFGALQCGFMARLYRPDVQEGWATPGILEALIPGRMQGHGGTEEVPG